MTAFKMTVLTLACFFAGQAVVCEQVVAQTVSAQALRELRHDDAITVKPGRVIRDCTTMLETATGLSAAQRAELFRLRGNAYVALWQLELAKADCEELRKLDPTSKEARLLRAKVLAYMGSTAEAHAELNGLLKEYPNHAPGYCMAAVMACAENEMQVALEQATKAIRLDQSCAHAYFIRASVHASRKDWHGCLEDLDRYLGLRPEGNQFGGADPYLLKGFALRQAGKYEQSLSAFLLARRLDPKSADALYGIWQAYCALGKQQLCVLIAEEMLELFPEKGEAYDYSAYSLTVVGRLDEAIQVASKWVTLEPANSEARTRLASIYGRKNDYERALREYEKALLQNPRELGAIFGAAGILACCPDAKLRDGQRALKLAREVCATFENNRPDLLLLVASAYAESGDYKEALWHARMALALTKEDSEYSSTCKKFIALFEAGKPHRFTTPSALTPPPNARER